MNDDLTSWMRQQSATMAHAVDAPAGLFDRLRFVADLIRAAPSIPTGPVLLRRDSYENLQITPVHAGIIIGREAPSDLILSDTRLSRQHFAISVINQHCVLKDLNSRNGTWVNGKQIKELPLKDGDIIEAGGSVWAFLLSPESPKSSCQ